MHTTEGNSATFSHNGDYSGKVKISVLDQKPLGRVVSPGQSPDGKPHVSCTIEVDFEDLRDLVFGYLRGKIIAELESADNDSFETMIVI